MITDDLRIDLRADGGVARAQAMFAEHGMFIAQGLLPVALLDDIRREIRRLIELGWSIAGGPRPPAGGFDSGFAALSAADPNASEAIFGACRRLASVHRLSVESALLELSARLMDTDMVMVPPYKPVRIDYGPRADALLPWHQDYPYAQDSPDGVVYWIPLADVDEQNGCLRAIPGSHADGVHPVEMIPPLADAAPIKGLRLTASDYLACERRPQLSLPMRVGEVLVLSALLLHRSQPNTSGAVRWTVQVRHGNFAHPTAVAKGWPRGHYEGHWFDETHPEHVHPGEEP
ncbi:MAG: phytanoyl-CoA dioxygenase family protein [Nannocystis sp.]|nr:phytanoyl-CoA dioxygenase family protein [Nannocystis sp.]